MILMSLKTHQLLILNPLDLSIDITRGLNMFKVILNYLLIGDLVITYLIH